MKVLIAGLRSITDYKQFYAALMLLVNTENTKGNRDFITLDQVTEIVSGAANGVDKLGEKFAHSRNIEVKQFFPDWQTHGKSAGFIRNQAMIDYLSQDDIVILIWDGKSKGTASTKRMAERKGLRVYEAIVEPNSNIGHKALFGY